MNWRKTALFATSGAIACLINIIIYFEVFAYFSEFRKSGIINPTTTSELLRWHLVAPIISSLGSLLPLSLIHVRWLRGFLSGFIASNISVYLFKILFFNPELYRALALVSALCAILSILFAVVGRTDTNWKLFALTLVVSILLMLLIQVVSVLSDYFPFIIAWLVWVFLLVMVARIQSRATIGSQESPEGDAWIDWSKAAIIGGAGVIAYIITSFAFMSAFLYGFTLFGSAEWSFPKILRVFIFAPAIASLAGLFLLWMLRVPLIRGFLSGFIAYIIASYIILIASADYDVSNPISRLFMLGSMLSILFSIIGRTDTSWKAFILFFIMVILLTLLIRVISPVSDFLIITIALLTWVFLPIMVARIQSRAVQPVMSVESDD